MNFRTQYDEHPRFFCSSGSPDKVLYSSSYDKFGNIQLEECGKQSLYDYIQSFAESVDINIILNRFAAGDVAALNSRQGAFMDISEMPKTYAEMLNLIAAGEQMFANLPVEVRAEYDHNFAQWLFSHDKGIYNTVAAEQGSPATQQGGEPQASSAESEVK